MVASNAHAAEDEDIDAMFDGLSHSTPSVEPPPAPTPPSANADDSREFDAMFDDLTSSDSGGEESEDIEGMLDSLEKK